MKNKVYLAGGMASNWQQRIIDELQGDFVFFNPADHRLQKVEEYTVWDLHYVKRCDVLFAYMEDSNPSGFGLTLEIGYAKAFGKTIILVDEKSNTNSEFARSFKFITTACDISFTSLDEGVKMLKSMADGVY